ncbi:MAG: hypothetical protein M1300_02295 [Epsilonproteobacteria bacterium]|nr:hypothetical protein [Campylobacterota bacterium]
MGTVLVLIGIGFVFGLLVFFFCEEKSLKDVKFSDMKCMITEEANISECFEKFKTVRYLAFYFAVMFVFDVLIANFIYLPNGYGLLEITLYTFVPSLVGSGIILLVKWTYQPIIKLVSSFLFGSIFMGASGLAFVLTYLING